MQPEKKCQKCGIIYPKKVYESKKVWALKKYCSSACYGESIKGHKIRLGMKHSEKTKKKISAFVKNNPQRYWLGKKLPKHVVEGKTGENNKQWKGDKVSKKEMHNWLYKHFGKPDKCRHCGKKNRKYGRSILDWANISKKYKRTIDDFMPLCRKCHVAYDKEQLPQLYGQ